MANFNLGDKILCKNISYDDDTWSATVTEVIPRGVGRWWHYEITFDGAVVPAVNTTNARGPQGGTISVEVFSSNIIRYIDKEGDDARRKNWPALQVTREAESKGLLEAFRKKQ